MCPPSLGEVAITKHPPFDSTREQLMPNPEQDELIRVLEAAAHQAKIWIENRSQVPVAPAAIAIPTPDLPGRGYGAEGAIEAFLQWARAGITNSAGPNYFGFVTGGVLPGALAGDWMASVIDQNAATSVTSPAASATEAVVIRWMLDLLGLPVKMTGVMTSGATMSNFLALAAGRQAVGTALGFDPTIDGLSGNPPIRVVTSTEVHSSAVKALGALGLGRGAMIHLPATGGAIDVDSLEIRLRENPQPCIIIANASEVNTGQFDDLAAIARLRDTYSPQSWIHVDGAFGAFAAVSPHTKHLLNGSEQADSLTADGHKWLNVPYDAGFVFYRDADAGRAAFTIQTAYQTRDGGFDADTMSLEFSRRFRALPAWCALYSIGRHGFRQVVEQSLANANLLRELIENDSGIELVNREAQLANPFCIVAFRITHESWSTEEADEANGQAVNIVNSAGSSYVSGTIWQGRAAMRAAFVNWQTRAEHVRQLFADIQQAREQILG